MYTSANLKIFLHPQENLLGPYSHRTGPSMRPADAGWISGWLQWLEGAAGCLSPFLQPPSIPATDTSHSALLSVRSKWFPAMPCPTSAIIKPESSGLWWHTKEVAMHPGCQADGGVGWQKDDPGCSPDFPTAGCSRDNQLPRWKEGTGCHERSSINAHPSGSATSTVTHPVHPSLHLGSQSAFSTSNTCSFFHSIWLLVTG